MIRTILNVVFLIVFFIGLFLSYNFYIKKENVKDEEYMKINYKKRSRLESIQLDIEEYKSNLRKVLDSINNKELDMEIHFLILKYESFIIGLENEINNKDEQINKLNNFFKKEQYNQEFKNYIFSIIMSVISLISLIITNIFAVIKNMLEIKKLKMEK